MAVDGSGRYLAVVTSTPRVYIIDLRLGRITKTIVAFKNKGNTVVTTPDGASFIVGGFHGRIARYEYASGRQLGKSIDLGWGENAESFIMHPHGAYFAMKYQSKDIQLRDPRTFALVRGLDAHCLNQGMAISPDGKTIAVACLSTTWANRAALRETVLLGDTVNKTEVAAMERRGRESLRAMTQAKLEEARPGALYFLGFGVSNYRDDTLDLAYAHKDVQDLARLLSSSKGRFQTVHTKVITDEAVSPAALAEAKEFFASATIHDTVVLFIAGHGVHDRTLEATYYFLPHAADVTRLSETAIPFDKIESLLDGIAPRRKLFLMDTCESGEAEEETEHQSFALARSRGLKPRAARGLQVKLAQSASASPEMMKRQLPVDRERYIYNDLMRRTGAIIFSSSRGGEYSYESDRVKNGFFTAALLEALRGKADTGRDGRVDDEELRSYVSDAVIRLTDGLQHPTVDRDNLFQEVILENADPPR